MKLGSKMTFKGLSAGGPVSHAERPFNHVLDYLEGSKIVSWRSYFKQQTYLLQVTGSPMARNYLISILRSVAKQPWMVRLARSLRPLYQQGLRQLTKLIGSRWWQGLKYKRQPTITPPWIPDRAEIMKLLMPQHTTRRALGSSVRRAPIMSLVPDKPTPISTSC